MFYFNVESNLIFFVARVSDIPCAQKLLPKSVERFEKHVSFMHTIKMSAISARNKEEFQYETC